MTRQHIGPALEAIDDLFESRQRLARVIDEAKESRSRISALTFWDNSEHLRRAFELLEGPSIHCAAPPTPLVARALLSETTHEVMATPDALLAEMVQRFDVARDGVAALSRAWSALEREVEAVEHDLAALRADAAGSRPDASLGDAIAAAERELAHVRRQVAVDPLGSEVSVLHVLRPRIEELRRRTAAEGALRQEVERALTRAQATAGTLIQAHARACEMVTGACERFVQAPQWPQPCDDETLAGLGAWLATLEKTIGQGHWASARVGLERWAHAAASSGAVDDAAIRAVEERERWREELVGRVSARRAQAAAIASRIAAGAPPTEGPDPSLRNEVEAAAARLAHLLERRPIDVDAAETAAQVLEDSVAKLRARVIRRID